MYNCIYDCKYCFLQGLYSSANYLVFVNYEDFLNQIKNLVTKNKGKSITFFSGYDCDSLAMEKVTSFADFFLKNYLENKKIISKNFTKQIAFNLIPHIDSFDKDGYTKEELKMTNETKKILDN